MAYTLFLDDQRTPVVGYGEDETVVVRSVAVAMDYIIQRGECPSELQLDHDLGEDENGELPNGKAFLRQFTDAILDGLIEDEVTCVIIHSRNEPAARDMQSIWNSYAKVYNNPTVAILRPRQFDHC